MQVDAVRYNGTIHDFVLLNALRHVPSTEAAIDQINDGLRQYLESVTHTRACIPCGGSGRCVGCTK